MPTNTFSVTLQFDSCIVVSDVRDLVQLQLATTDQFGREIQEYANLHNGFEEFNGRDLSIYTVKGNGARLARMLGYWGVIKVINTSTGTETFIASWEDVPESKET